MRAAGHVTSAVGIATSLVGLYLLAVRVVIPFVIPVLFQDTHVSPDMLLDDPAALVLPLILTVLGITITLAGIGIHASAPPKPKVAKSTQPDYEDMSLEELLNFEHQRMFKN